MSQQLGNLVKKFGEDPQLVEQYKEDPEAVMLEHGLSEEHKELFRQGDKEGIRQAAGANAVHADFIIF